MFITYDAAEKTLQRLVPPFTSRGWASVTLAKVEPMLLVNFIADIAGEMMQRCTISLATDPFWGLRRSISSLTLLIPAGGAQSGAWQAASVSQVFFSGTSDHIRYVTRSGNCYVVPSHSDFEASDGDWVPNYSKSNVHVVSSPRGAPPLYEEADWLKVYEA